MKERKRGLKETLCRKEFKESEIETGVVKWFDRNRLRGKIYPDSGSNEVSFSISGFRNIVSFRDSLFWSGKRERQILKFDELPVTGTKVSFEREIVIKRQKELNWALIWGFREEFEKVKSGLKMLTRYRIVVDTPEGPRTIWTSQNPKDPALARLKGGQFEKLEDGKWVEGKDPR